MNIDAEIIKHWDAGLSSKEIGDLLGRTRSAIMGRIHRLRAKGVDLHTRMQTKKQDNDEKKPKKIKIRKIVHEAKSKNETFDAIENEYNFLTLLELSYADCRYVVGKSSSGYLYCGQPSVRRQMCQSHYRLCYVVIKK